MDDIKCFTNNDNIINKKINNNKYDNNLRVKNHSVIIFNE